MGAYTSASADLPPYQGLTGVENLVRTTAGFGQAGKVVQATRLYTTKIESGGWPTTAGSSGGIEVTPTPGVNQFIYVQRIIVHKAGTNRGSNWGDNPFPATFTQRMNNGSYATLGGVARDTIVNGTGVWIYNAYPWVFNGFTNAQNEQNGYTGNPILLQTAQVISGNQPTWYVQVEFSMLNLDNFRNNVDITYT